MNITNMQSIRKQIFFLKCVQHMLYLEHSRHFKKWELITEMHAGIKQQNTTAGQSRETKRSQTRIDSDK